jgi:valyl-tRNA synthetase
VLATVPVPGGGMQVLPSDAFDPAEAERRLAARRDQLEGEIQRAEHRLANEQFVARAPADVVAEERRKLEEYREALRRLGD